MIVQAPHGVSLRAAQDLLRGQRFACVTIKKI
jgi:hypothetical protein